MRLLFGRILIAFICATSVLPMARAEAPSHITDWAELLPKGLYDFFPEDMTTALWVDPTFQQKVAEAERKTRPDVHNRPILLPGYMVPLVYDGDDVSEFLLVPSAGNASMYRHRLLIKLSLWRLQSQPVFALMVSPLLWRGDY